MGTQRLTKITSTVNGTHIPAQTQRGPKNLTILIGTTNRELSSLKTYTLKHKTGDIHITKNHNTATIQPSMNDSYASLINPLLMHMTPLHYLLTKD